MRILIPLLTVVLAISTIAAGDPASFAAERLGKVDAARWEPVYDFTDQAAKAEMVHAQAISPGSYAASGKSYPGFMQHPSVKVGDPPAETTFKDIVVPSLAPTEKLLLHFRIALRDGFKREDVPQADGCAFVVLVNGEQVYNETYAEQRWREWVADLTPFAGQSISVTFLTAPLANSNCDWAIWGRPRILIEGRKAALKKGPEINYLRLDTLDAAPPRDRVFATQDGAAWTGVAVLDEFLDIPSQLLRHAAETGPAPVALPPALVVGEGPDPENHTLVRVLNRYGIADVQFMAYPESVLGGVQVRALKDASGDVHIAAAPIADKNERQVRIFDTWGGLLGFFDPGEDVHPPYVIATGFFAPGDKTGLVAVMSAVSAEPNRPLKVFRATGKLIYSSAIEFTGPASMTTKHGDAVDTILISLPGSGKAMLVDPSAGGVVQDVMGIPQGAVAYPSAFDQSALLAALPGEQFSEVAILKKGVKSRILNTGEQENLFWYQWYSKESLGEGRYVRTSEFAHIRTDIASPGLDDPTLDPADTEAWTSGPFQQRAQGEISKYASAPPRLWEPCFTHRQPIDNFKKWTETIDPETGFPRYNTLTRNNNIVTYGEFDTVGFVASTYAPNLPALDALYVKPLRAFLRLLAPAFRENPTHFVALEPNHEHEIAVDAEGTKGDYNPRMIEGFYQYLRGLAGTERARLAELASFPADAAFFDAPRDWERASWDTYDDSNPLYKAWISYNRYVVNQRLAQTFREALLAGFPPETIKSHQIPDTYAIGNLQAFSDVVSRYTPIDYAMNAGVGYGYTRYTTWYKDKHNVMQGAWSSGFDMVTLGEYQALTPSDEEAWGQLKYIFDHGGYSVHCMMWPEGYDKGFNASMDAALRRIIAEDPPRPGVTGGVGEIRSAMDELNQPLQIVCLGTGPAHNGLLKSVDAEGKWDGKVYVTPFRAHITVDRLEPVAANGGWRIGPLNGLDSGTQIEVTLAARAANSGAVKFTVQGPASELEGVAMKAPVGPDWKPCRYVFRVQAPVEGLTLAVSLERETETRDLMAWRETEQTTKLTKGVLEGQRHKGAVTFDVLN